MKYCSNCGEQVDEKAVICVKCGVPINNGMQQPMYNQPSVPKQSHGAATASLVLGILGVIAAVITLIIAICIYAYYSSVDVYDIYSSYNAFETSTKIGVCIFLSVIPGILSLIGLPLGCFCRKGGPKIAGIVLNTITLAICIIQVVLVMNT